jgi:hypothetical protein
MKGRGNAGEARGILPLRRCSILGRKPYAAALPALLLHDLPEDRWRRRLRHRSRRRFIHARHRGPGGARDLSRAEIVDGDGRCQTSEGQRHFCRFCASALWLYDERWSELVHPFASVIDTPLPVPPERTHLMLRFKADWVVPTIGPNDAVFDVYPEVSIEDWHRSRGLWVD